MLGGAERALLLLLASIDHDRFRAVLATSADSVMAARSPVAVHPVVMDRIQMRSPVVASRLVRGAARLVRAVRQEDAALLHANTYRTAYYTALAARLSGRPWIWHVRDLHRRSPGVRVLAAVATRIIAVSAAARDYLPTSGQRKASVIYDGIDFSRFDPSTVDRTAVRRSLGIDAAAPLVVTIGYGSPVKRHDHFVAIAAALRSRVPAARFVIVGGLADPRYAAWWRRVEADARRAGVILAGLRDDVPNLMAAADLLVHLSGVESFGLVSVEAMAMGKAVVTVAGGAASEIVVDGVTGRVVPLDGATEAIADLLSDPDRSRRYGGAGRARALAMFNPTVTARQVEAVYAEVLATRRSAAGAPADRT